NVTGVQTCALPILSAQAGIEGIVLFLRRQFTVDEEVADFDEVRLLGKLLDRIAAILQDTFVAIDEGDGRRGGCGVGKPWIVCDLTGLFQQRADTVSVVARRRRHLGQCQLRVSDPEVRLRSHSISSPLTYLKNFLRCLAQFLQRLPITEAMRKSLHPVFTDR